jgi:hypothetical protein
MMKNAISSALPDQHRYRQGRWSGKARYMSEG